MHFFPQDPALWDVTPGSLVDRYEPTRRHILQNYNRYIHSIQNMILLTVQTAVLRCGAGESWLEYRAAIGGKNSFFTINLSLRIHSILEEIFSWQMDCTSFTSTTSRLKNALYLVYRPVTCAVRFLELAVPSFSSKIPPASPTEVWHCRF